MALEIDPLTGQIETFTGDIWSSSALEQKTGAWKEQVKQIGIQTSALADEELKKTQEMIEPQPVKAYDVDVASPTGERLRISTTNLAEYLEKGFKVVPTETTEEPIGAVIPSEILEGEETEEEKEAEKISGEIAGFESQITIAQSNIAKTQSSIKDDSAYEETGEIRNIRLEYDRRREEIRKMGELQKKALTTMAIRWGTERYSPLLAANIISSYENILMDKINDLKREEDQAVNAMKTAIRKENYNLYLDEKEKLEKKRTEKVDALKELNKEIKRKNDEMKKAQEKAKKSIIINDLNNQGKTAEEIYDAINFDSEGNMIADPITILEIKKAVEEVKITDEVRIENINKFFEEKAERITTQDYLQARKDWIASDGTLTDFKGAFPPDSILDEKELKKLPKSVWIPVKPEKLTEAEKLVNARKTMYLKLDNVKGEDGYISPQDWNEAKRSWIVEGLGTDDFIKQFYIYINPTHSEDYGQREANYIREIGEGEGISNPFE